MRSALGSESAAVLEHGLCACWSIPIAAALGNAIGTIGIYFPDPAKPTEEELSFVSDLVRLAGIALQKDLVERTFRKAKSATDP